MHNDLNSSSSFPQMHTKTSSQKNQHRDILAKKKKTQTEKQTNPNGKTKKRQIGAYRNDRSLWVSLGRSSWVSLGRSSWAWVLIGARSYGSVSCGLVLLWIDACDWSCGSVIGAADRCCGSMIGAVDRCL